MFHRMMNYGELDARPNVVLTKELIRKSMPKYRRHDDLIIINESVWEEFKQAMPIAVVKEENSPFSIDEDELASLVCQSIQKPTCRRLAIERKVKSDGFRTPNISLILGDTGIVCHKDNHIIYQFDVTKCMFSFGNVREKMRMAELRCSDEIIVDLFAGIGYFTLPFLVHAKAKHLYACEWNPDAIEALKKNLILNNVDKSRYTVIEGDNRQTRPENVAQRVLLGILPSCMDWMRTAFQCIDKSTGAILHCHDLVETSPPSQTQTTIVSSKNDDSKSAPNLTNNPKHESNDKQGLAISSSDISVPSEKPSSSSDNQSLINQSLSSSSTSSHSTIEKLSAPSEDSSRLLHSCESDKDPSSPILLERFASNVNVSSHSGSSFETAVSVNNSNPDQTSLTSSSHLEDSILEPPILPDTCICAHEARGFALIESIREDLEKSNMVARLLHIQPVKSYAPHVTHVVFDIKIVPRHRV